MNTTPAARLIRLGLWALPAYGLLIMVTTLRPQPDPVSDPEGWASFVSSSSYLVGHVAGNVLGTILVIFGTFALGAFLSAGQAPRLALAGMVLSVTSYVLFTVPGVISTFATPTIGAAYLAGNPTVMELEFSPIMTMIIVAALLLAVVGNAVLSVAGWRSSTLPRWAGVVWAAGTLTFYVLGFALGMATTGASLPTQPIGAVLLAVGDGWIAGPLCDVPLLALCGSQWLFLRPRAEPVAVALQIRRNCWDRTGQRVRKVSGAISWFAVQARALHQTVDAHRTLIRSLTKVRECPRQPRRYGTSIAHTRSASAPCRNLFSASECRSPAPGCCTRSAPRELRSSN